MFIVNFCYEYKNKHLKRNFFRDSILDVHIAHDIKFIKTRYLEFYLKTKVLLKIKELSTEVNINSSVD